MQGTADAVGESDHRLDSLRASVESDGETSRSAPSSETERGE